MGRKRKPHAELVCLQCGKPLTARTYYRKDGGVHHIYQPTKYCSNRCVGMAAHLRQLAKASGRFLDKSGYVMLSKRRGGASYQQPEHRAIMEGVIGRKLLPSETVHHKNGIRTDNRPENLELWVGRHGRGQRATDLIDLQGDIWNGMTPHWQIGAAI